MNYRRKRMILPWEKVNLRSRGNVWIKSSQHWALYSLILSLYETSLFDSRHILQSNKFGLQFFRWILFLEGTQGGYFNNESTNTFSSLTYKYPLLTTAIV